MIKKLFLACLVAFCLGFGQSTSQQGEDDYQLSEEDLFLVQMLLSDGLFRDNFVQACAMESIEWLGAQWAEKTCSCAYDNLAKNQALLLKFLNTDEEGVEADKMSFELLEKCLPQKFPPEMETAIVRECMNGGIKKSACDCVVGNIKKKYSVKSFMKGVLESPTALEKVFTDITIQCGVQ